MDEFKDMLKVPLLIVVILTLFIGGIGTAIYYIDTNSRLQRYCVEHGKTAVYKEGTSSTVVGCS